MTNDSGHVEFVTRDAHFEPAVFSGIPAPLNFFDRVRGAMDIQGDTLRIVSCTLEGNDIYARLKGTINSTDLDMTMEVMPGKSFLDDPLFSTILARYNTFRVTDVPF